LPSHRSADEPPAAAPRTAVSGPLPASARRARITATATALTARPGEQLSLEVEVENVGDRPWPCLAGQGHGLYLGNHWLLEDGALCRMDDGRCPLPYDLAPGAKALLLLPVQAPQWPGDYGLELDMVQEEVAWFEPPSSCHTRLRCHVEGSPSGVRPKPLPLPEQSLLRRLASVRIRDTHPHLHRTLQATGLLALYWRLRRGLDALSRLRDVWRMRRARRSRRPEMAMHCVLRAEVVELIQAAGGEVL